MTNFCFGLTTEYNDRKYAEPYLPQQIYRLENNWIWSITFWASIRTRLCGTYGKKLFEMFRNVFKTF